MSYVLPQVLVHQEFAAAPATASQPQRACVVGPNYDLHRYANASEKSGIKVTSHYDPTSEECFGWPGRRAGAVVDLAYVKAFVEKALLRYFHDAIGAGSDIVPVSRNRIRSDSVIWKTANGYARNAALYDRDVRAGDGVRLMSNACGTPETFETSVIGFAADKDPAVIDPATIDTHNQADQGASATGDQTAGPYNMVLLGAVDGSAYDGTPDGNVTEVYTVEVIGASVGGDATTGVLKVTSASGNDDVAAVTPAAFGAPTNIGTRGLTAVFDNSSSSSSMSPDVDVNDFVLGQTWRIEVHQAWSHALPTAGGLFVGAFDTTYVVEVTRGGLYTSPTKPQISVSTTTGVDISGPTDVTAVTDAVIGTRGVLAQFSNPGAGAGLCKGDRYYVTVTAEKDGAVKTLILANSMPESFLGECISSGVSSSSGGTALDLDVQLFIVKSAEIPKDRTGFAPLVNWIASATEICLQDGVVLYDSTWTDLAGVELPLPLLDGEIYVQHRDLLTVGCDIVGTVEETSAVEAALGPVDPDNPLAFGVYKALLNSGGVSVKYVALCGVELEDWLAALDKLVGRADVYGLVPLTYDKDVQDAFKAHCDGESQPETGRWRNCWLCLQAVEIKPIYTEQPDTGPVLATITDDPDTSGTQYTLVTVTDGLLLTKGVRAGDTVRALYVGDGFGNYTYSEFEVDSVESEDVLKLVSGPSAPVNMPSKIEIHRTLTVDELSTDLAQNPGLFSDRRAKLVWPDVLGNAGTTFPGYFLACGLAGLRSGVLPHQGLTNIALTGFDDVSRTVEKFSATQLNRMAEAGYWIVTQDEDSGAIITRHQLTTDMSDVKHREDNITSNLDDISMSILTTMKEFIGKGNVSDAMIDIIHAELNGILTGYVNTITVKRLGPQIQSFAITELAQHPTLLDRITARVSLTLPAPLNNLEIYLVA